VSVGAAVRLAGGSDGRLARNDPSRPGEAQGARWRALPDHSCIADPAGGSTHSRGIAVDLTLADGSGRPLDMGTGFDDMTEQSHHGRTDLTTEQQRNRAALLGVMTAAGWRHYSFEWWHYQLPDEQRYPLLTDAALGGLMMG
ncbi:D-alanyl-D-alanine dipeptidase, partial [Azospirillum brasilense]|nr:D-alanyl-D-alanine dipeptidase [Azospirillum brasilense]